MGLEELDISKDANGDHDAGADECDGKRSPAEYLVSGDFPTGWMDLGTHR